MAATTLTSSWITATLVVGLLLAAASIDAALLTISHLPPAWRQTPLTVSIQAEDVTPWCHRFEPRSTLAADVDLQPFLRGQYVRVELIAPAAALSCSACDPRSASLRIPTRRLRQTDSFYLEDESKRILMGPDHRPTHVTFTIPKGESSLFVKELVILTRGTRGDVQPFLALSRHLAEHHNYHITICTESYFQSFIEDRSDVRHGRLDFCPSGGDTAAKMAEPFAQSVLAHPSARIQAACMALCEVEYFDSEPVMYDLVRRTGPDAVLYGLTMISMAALISESLRVPAIAVLLQAAGIPSRTYRPIVCLPGQDADNVDFKLVRALRGVFAGDELNRLRRRRGLRGTRSDPYDYLLAQEAAPIVVPMDECAFGQRPADWPSSIVMSGFIYLPEPESDADIVEFTDSGLPGPVISISFSSMPVNAVKLSRLVWSIATQSVTKPRIVLVGGDPSASDREELRDLIRQRRLLHVRSVPFGRLFKRVNAAIVHGGLGTTAEVLRAGIPVLVTGTLLMDQRFWADRLYRLGLGPPMVPFGKFVQDAASVIDQFFREFDQYRSRALDVSRSLRDGGLTGTAHAILQAMEVARPMDCVRCPRPAWLPPWAWLAYWTQLGSAILSTTPTMLADTVRQWHRQQQ